MRAAERFAQNLAAARKQAGLSQEETGLKASIHPTWISHLESGQGNPTLDTIVRLAAALETKPADLLAGIGGER